ncbi:MAG: DUF4417 domain-containing protein [Lachnospiraceae bacterium]|nr:DUF4417 domain-containing protein [Lachnospiraceae bacterium]
MTSASMRSNALFTRNEFYFDGKWEIPFVHKQSLVEGDIRLLACSDTRPNETDEYKRYGVEFFVDDYRFSGTYENPKASLARYSQYAFLLTPDFSLYADMPLWLQIENTAKNRWVGAFWQKQGFTVYPTISWSTPRSFDFCFSGTEKGSVVAVGMIGCKNSRSGFMRGYNAMLERIEPSAVICYGTPFPEMEGNIITIPYSNRKRRSR